MSTWPLDASGLQRAVCATPTLPFGLGLSAAGTAGTKTAWSTAFASTPFAFQTVTLRTTGPVADSMAYIDLAIGGAGDETVIATELPVASGPFGSGGAYLGGTFILPVFVPAGVRLALRSGWNVTTGNSLQVELNGYAGSWLAGAGTGGVHRVDSGTLLAPLQTTATGVWTQVCAAMPFTATGIYVALAAANQYVGTVLDVGVGPAGSEAVLLAGLSPMPSEYGNNIGGTGFIPLAVPAGARLAIRPVNGANNSFAVAAARA